MQLKYKRWVKDPWIFFSLFAVFIAIGLIIVPQFRLMFSSIKEERGIFFLRLQSDTGIAKAISEGTKGFEIEEINGLLTIKKNDKQLLTIESWGEGKILLILNNGERIDFERISIDKIRIFNETTDFIIKQKIFSQPIFDEPQSLKPLDLEIIDDNTILLKSHNGAYLSFEDKRTEYTLNNYSSFFIGNKYIDAIKNSLIVTVASSILATTLAVSLAYYFARYQFAGKNLIITLITMGAISPPFLGAYIWRMLLGSQGIITRLLNLNFTIVNIYGVIWVITWLTFPLIFLLTYDSFTAIDRTLIESSFSLGANRKKTLFRIEIPLAIPGIITGVYLAMMTAFADFGTPYVISVNLNVLPVLVYKEYMSEVGSNFPMASTGSMVMIALSSIILMGQRIYLASKSFASISSRDLILIEPSKHRKIFIMTYALIIISIIFIPHITVTITSLLTWSAGIVKPIITLGNYSRMFKTELHSIYVSFFLGITAVLFDIIFGAGIAYIIVRKRYPFLSNFLNILIMIPYIIPGTVLGIGFILIFNTPPIILTGTWVILMLSYFIRKLPFSVKASEAILYQIHPDLEEAAKCIGAKPARSFFDVTFKLMMGGVISGATLSFLHIMTEISSTIVLYRPPWKPMTAVIFENTTRAGSDFGLASAITVVLMIFLYVPLYILTKRTRFQKKGGKIFDAY
jgi:iron(III) transport system permease protein